MARDPILLAMVLADNVAPDPNSGKNFILGTITRMFAHSLPARMNNISIYVCVGDAQDCRVPAIEIVNLKDNSTLVRKNLPALPKRATVGEIELAINLGGIQFPEHGFYEFRVWMDNKFVGARKFSVAPWPKQP